MFLDFYFLLTKRFYTYILKFVSVCTCENTRVLRIFVTVRTSGGAIRDVLIGLTPTDVDLATNAPPHLVESIVSASPGLAFGKAPKRSRNFGSYKVN